MAGQVFPIVHSTLHADALGQEVARLYDIATPVHCELLARGINDNYIVRAGDERYALRAWRYGLREDFEIAYELVYSDYLKSRGIPLAAPIATRDGGLDFCVEAPEGRRHVAMFEWAEGGPLHAQVNESLAFEAGVLAARLREVAPGFKIAEPRYIDTPAELREKLPALLDMMAHEPDTASFLKGAVEATAAALDDMNPHAVPMGPSHGDIHTYNVFVSPDRKTLTLLDFDLCGVDQYAKELGSFIWRSRYEGLSEAINDAFVAGYESVFPLNDTERSLVPLFVLARDLWILCGTAGQIDTIGRSSVGYAHKVDVFTASVRRHLAEAGLS
jgi:Ser/Thr protein kinase RdoA (MazF antagonist)